MSDTTKKTAGKNKPEYDSNPFTLSFRGFGLFTQYAKSILIAVIIFGLLGLFFNVLTSIPDLQKEKNTNYGSYKVKSDVNGSGSVSIRSYDQESDNSDVIINEGDKNIVSDLVYAFIPIFIIVMLFGLSIGNLFATIISGVLAAGALSAINKKEITFGQAFSEMGTRFGVLYWANLIAILKIIGGYFLLVVPGVRAQLRYSALPYVVMANKDFDSKQSLSATKDLYRKHLMESFGINTVGAIIPVIGQAITASGFALSIQQLSIYKKDDLVTPKTHWLNYLGLIFFLFLLLFILMMVGLAAFFLARN